MSVEFQTLVKVESRKSLLTKGEFQTPVAYLDLPSGLAVYIKQILVKEVAEFIHDAYI